MWFPKATGFFCLLLQVLYTQALEDEATVRADGGANHPCYRECVNGRTLTCTYNFTVSEFISMSADCGNCPFDKADCLKPGCITAGGSTRPVSVINQQLPGTSIQVCLGDTVVINMLNSLPIEATTIHWHGIHQNDRPYMDGVPFVTQCPVLPHDSFQYKYLADTPGTNLYHSHVGYEEADGMFGSLIVRRPISDEPNAKLYDHDLAEHVVVVWHWFAQPTKEAMTTAYFLNTRSGGKGLIVNGKGHILNFSLNGSTYSTPQEIFTVTQGLRYRFRVIFNTALPCAVQMSVDNHTLLVISSDGGSLDPIEVNSIMLNGGERYDFVLNANQSIDNYWIRFRGAGACISSKVHQEAILHYDGAADDPPSGTPTYEQAVVSGKLLNPTEEAFVNYPNNNLILLSDLNNNERNPEDISGTPDHILYYQIAFNSYVDADFAGPYAQINDISFQFPSFPLLTQRDEITTNAFCSERPASCKAGSICRCPYVLAVELGSLVEVVFVDTSLDVGFNHPMHLHGYAFQVVAMNTVQGNISLELIKEVNELGLINKKLHGAPIKDTVSVPTRGYAIMRFIANNPGYWIFHCHISNHAEMGMASVLKVGEHSEMVPTPSNFPRCGNWKLQD